MRGVEQGGKSPFSLLSEPISPSSLLFKPISPSSLNASFSFSPYSLLFPPISPSSQLYLGHKILPPPYSVPPPSLIMMKLLLGRDSRVCNLYGLYFSSFRGLYNVFFHNQYLPGYLEPFTIIYNSQRSTS